MPAITTIEVNSRIDQYPTILSPVNNTEKELTIGDVHGNFMYLFFALVYHKVIINLRSEDYNKLYVLYTTPTDSLTDSNISEFNEIISHLQFNTSIHVRLLGDEVADRGQNDYFTLQLFNQMNRAQVSFEILFSNHGAEFISGYEAKTFSWSLLPPQYTKSMYNLRKLIMNKKLLYKVEENVYDIIENVYKKHLKAISYTAYEETNEIILYSHAPIGLSNIQQLANRLGVYFNDTNLLNLVNTINQINTVFSRIVAQDGVSLTLFNNELIKNPILPAHAFEFLAWNRVHNTLDRPLQHATIRMKWANGHEHTAPHDGHSCFTLDTSNLGKSPSDIAGFHLAMITDKSSIKLAPMSLCEMPDPDEPEGLLEPSAYVEFAHYNNFVLFNSPLNIMYTLLLAKLGRALCKARQDPKQRNPRVEAHFHRMANLQWPPPNETHPFKRFIETCNDQIKSAKRDARSSQRESAEPNTAIGIAIDELNDFVERLSSLKPRLP